MVTDMKNREIVVLIDKIRNRILADKVNANATLEEFDFIFNSWEMWVLDNAIYILGAKHEDFIYIKALNTIDKLLPLMTGEISGVVILATLRCLALKNDYFHDAIMKEYYGKY